MIISLTGPMGCGKSSVGRKLTTLLRALCNERAEERVRFLDLDDYIEESAGMSIPDIFAQGGESSFRIIETRCLEEIIDEHAENKEEDMMVLSLGGGAVLKNSELLHNSTICIFLDASVETLVSRLIGNTESRPLLASETKETLAARVSSILEQRRELYEKTAVFTVKTDGINVYQCACEIIRLLENSTK